ncbi:lasso peptide [Calothrix sp. CCY 0018]|uniref:lasso peptide n=1 Tax=Calothrix sp. CCY 0018 TaxID=3103864 RepID=UPI0039C68CDB
MKKTYTAPKLSSFGNVTEITQVIGGDARTDFVFQNGEVISGNNDLGSRDITLD